jgi:hypothetical protein
VKRAIGVASGPMGVLDVVGPVEPYGDRAAEVCDDVLRSADTRRLETIT